MRLRLRGEAPGSQPRSSSCWAVVVGAVAFLLVRDSDDERSPTTMSNPVTAGPFVVSAQGLSTLANAASEPIYWAGPRNVKLYELTQKANGDVVLRYLPKGAKAGYTGAALSVGTYPFKDAYGSAKRTASQEGTVTVPAPGKAFAFRGASSKTNVYVVFPGTDYQVEVYSPRPGEAQALVSGGEIVRVS